MPDFDITICPQCTQKVRVPNSAGTIRIDCPSCHHTWRWTPEEFITLKFVCGFTAKPFLVRFKRFDRESVFRIESTQKVESEPDTDARCGSDSNVIVYEGNNFDWSDWKCPYCNHPEKPPAATTFARCSRCNDLVCGFNSIVGEDGLSYFACHFKCQNTGGLGGDIVYTDEGSAHKHPSASHSGGLIVKSSTGGLTNAS